MTLMDSYSKAAMVEAAAGSRNADQGMTYIYKVKVPQHFVLDILTDLLFFIVMFKLP